jgi:hypothetical protein
MGVHSTAIDYRAEGKSRHLMIGKIGEVDIEGIEGADGSEVKVSNHPLCIAPGFPSVVAKSKSLRYQDHGYKWTLSERNGLYSPFAYQG